MKMNTAEKLKILSDAAKYDVSCSSSGSTRANIPGGTGNAAEAGICHSWSDDGRCISLLKVLFTNYCMYNCAYCINRSSNDIPRAVFTVRELANLTIQFYKRNYIEGLFLSSGVMRNPDYTMERLVETIRLLRFEYRFNGYIHLKAIPGASAGLLKTAGLYADRLSANIELPSERSLSLLAPEKQQKDIFSSMSCIDKNIEINRDEQKKYRKTPQFAPAGQSTQLIVGATSDSDHSILNLSESLYSDYRLKRVYYSAFVPVSADSRLPALKDTPLRREHRLYQADWLMRVYGFSSGEIIDEINPFLDPDIDPKACWALRHPEFFPVEINTAEYHDLIRIPGIGIKSAQKIIAARKFSTLDFEHLKKMHVVLKRAQFFITCKGKYLQKLNFSESYLKPRMIAYSNDDAKYTQLTLF